MKQQVSTFTPVLSGCMAGLALSSALSSLLAMAAMVGFVCSLRHAARLSRQVAAVALFSLSFLLGSLFWLASGIYHPPVNTLVSAVLLTSVLITFNAALYALVFAVVRTFSLACNWRGSLSLYLGLAMAWSMTEVLRSSGSLALPWGLLGVSQIDNPVLKGLYPVAGSHGVAAAAWLLAALLLEAGRGVVRLRPFSMASLLSLHKSLKPSTYAPWTVAGMLLTTAITSQWITWTHPSKQVLKVQLVHTILPGIDKHDPQAQLQALEALKQIALMHAADVTVFPELFLLQSSTEIPQTYRQAIVDAARSSRTSLIFGAPAGTVDAEGVPVRLNTLHQIDSGGQTHVYAKEILLPFSEYLPDNPLLTWAYPFLYRYPQADFGAGEPYQPGMNVNGIPLGLSICSELAYAGKSSRQALAAEVLINASNDAWIPSTAYLWQAQQIARVRAAEAQKPMVRSNNVGYSSFIDYHGNPLLTLFDRPGTAILEVVPRTGVTPYVAFSAWLSSGR